MVLSTKWNQRPLQLYEGANLLLLNEFATVIFQAENQQESLYSTGNSAQCDVAASVGGESGGGWIHVLCMPESLCCPPETSTTLLIGYTPI